MREKRLTTLIPIDQAMPILSDYCRTTHPGRLICPQWRPGEGALV